jgi:dihydroneopterin aldolase
VREVSDSQEYRLIESLASAVAEALAERFRPDRVRVQVRKPGISPAGLTVTYSAARAERGR